MTPQESLDRFTDILQIQFMHDDTKKNYLHCVTKFIEYCSWAETTDQITLSDFQDFVIYLSKHYAASTVGGYVSAIRTYAEAVLERTYTKRQIPKPKVKRQEAAFFTPEQVDIMLASCIDSRVKAWIILGFDCGMRVSEVARLKWSDIDHRNNVIQIWNSKRDKSRTVPYSVWAKDILNHYCQVYNVSPRTSEYVFPGKKEDSPISTSTISSYVKKHFKNFPFATDRHRFHSLRHSYATAMVERIVNPYVLKDLLGHSSFQTTMNYIHMSSISKKNVPSPCTGWELRGR